MNIVKRTKIQDKKSKNRNNNSGIELKSSIKINQAEIFDSNSRKLSPLPSISTYTHYANNLQLETEREKIHTVKPSTVFVESLNKPVGSSRKLVHVVLM